MSSPGQPYPYPSAPQVGPPLRRRRRSRWLTVGLPVGLVVLVLVGAGGWWLVSAVSGALGPVSESAHRYADALVAGRWADAQGQLCSADRVQVTPEQLAAHYGSPQLTDVQVIGVSVESSNGEQTGSVQLVLTTADGLDTETTLWMAREDGGWRPCP
ncbi:Rv0361 family membrane protein [Klenkia soli]|uniref:Rv0361 family membrane protein n=1 Tax=Klenkia soli TaxID=1052260 RepID=UPI00104242DD|nr:hypothetical protein [Klenkia soli]